MGIESESFLSARATVVVIEVAHQIQHLSPWRKHHGHGFQVITLVLAFIPFLPNGLDELCTQIFELFSDRIVGRRAFRGKVELQSATTVMDVWGGAAHNLHRELAAITPQHHQTPLDSLEGIRITRHHHYAPSLSPLEMITAR